MSPRSVDDYVVVRRISAQQTSQADDGVVFFCFRKSARGGGNFECPGDTNDFNVRLFGAGSQKSVVCAPKQPIGDELIEPRNYDSKMKVVSVQISGDRLLPNFLFGGFLRVSVSPW